MATQRWAQDHSRELEALTGELSSFRRSSDSQWRNIDSALQDIRDNISNHSRRHQRIMEDVSRKMDVMQVDVRSLKADIDRLTERQASSSTHQPATPTPEGLALLLQQLPGFQDALVTLMQNELHRQSAAAPSMSPSRVQQVDDLGNADEDNQQMNLDQPVLENDIVVPHSGQVQEDIQNEDLVEVEDGSAPSTSSQVVRRRVDPTLQAEPVHFDEEQSSTTPPGPRGAANAAHVHLEYDSSEDEEEEEAGEVICSALISLCDRH